MGEKRLQKTPGSMSVLELHAFPASPPSRAVHMTLDLLGLEYKYVEVAVLDGATRTPEYLSMNPQHTVPVLTDGNLVITESRAAMTYLVSQHKPGQLYPACAKKRSQIDQPLLQHWDTLPENGGLCVPCLFWQDQDYPTGEDRQPQGSPHVGKPDGSLWICTG